MAPHALLLEISLVGRCCTGLHTTARSNKKCRLSCYFNAMLASGFEAHNNFGSRRSPVRIRPARPRPARLRPAPPRTLPVGAKPLTSAEHTEQRPDRLGDWLERLVVGQLRFRRQRLTRRGRLADRLQRPAQLADACPATRPPRLATSAVEVIASMTCSRPTTAGHQAAALRLIEGGSTWCAGTRCAGQPGPGRSTAAAATGRAAASPPPELPSVPPPPEPPQSAASKYRDTSSAVSANCRGKCAYQALGQVRTR